MLGLKCESNAEWIARVSANPAVLLPDHAHCEKKAALNAIGFINRYPEKMELVSEMSELAEEEITHFRMVVKLMTERDIPLTFDQGDPYAQALHSMIRKTEPEKLLDKLIVSSLIEARSCERFSILSEHASDEELRIFYKSLLASEARHRNTFLNLARLYYKDDIVTPRLDAYVEFEASIVSSLTSGPTIHG
ncbi:MAG: tRNA-(ms[2]io[6]A)-hydroxylase [bacterium]